MFRLQIDYYVVNSTAGVTDIHVHIDEIIRWHIEIASSRSPPNHEMFQDLQAAENVMHKMMLYCVECSCFNWRIFSNFFFGFEKMNLYWNLGRFVMIKYGMEGQALPLHSFMYFIIIIY